MPAPFSGSLRALRAARGPGPALLLLPGGAVLALLGLWAAFAPVPLQLRSADASAFPDRARFEQLKSGGLLDSPEQAARKVLAWLARPDFGAEAVADVRG